MPLSPDDPIGPEFEPNEPHHKDAGSSEGQNLQTTGLLSHNPGRHYTRAYTSGSARRRHEAASGIIAEEIERIAAVAGEQGGRILYLASRRPPREEAVELAEALGARSVWEGQQSLSAVRLIDEMEATLKDISPGSACFIEATSLASIERGIGIGAQLLERGDDGTAADIKSFLEKTGSTLIVAVELEGLYPIHHTESQVPGCYIMPWIYGWFRELSQKSYVAAGVFNELRTALEETYAGEQPKNIELPFFEEMVELEATASTFGHDSLKTRVIAAIDAAKADAHDRKQGAIQRLDEVFDEGRNAASLGEIGKILVTLSLFTERQSAENLIWLAGALLPDMEMPFGQLPPLVRERWQRQADEHERIGVIRPALPRWRDILLQDPDAAILAAGLQREEGRIRPLRLSRQIDARGLLVERRGYYLRSLLLKIGEARLPLLANREQADCLIQFHTMLTLALGAQNDDAAARAFAGMTPQDGDLPLLPSSRLEAQAFFADAEGVIELPASTTLADIAALIEQLADQPASNVTALRAQYERWRLESVKVLTENLLRLQEMQNMDGKGDNGVPRVLATLRNALPSQTLLLTAAVFNFNGGAIPAQTLGAITYQALRNTPAYRRTDSVSELKEIWINLFHNAMRMEKEGGAGQAILPPLEIWADGIAAVANGREREGWFAGFSTYVDDFFSNHEISWNYRLEKNRLMTRSVMAEHVLLAPAGADGAPDLLLRLLARDPADWVARLRDYANLMTDGEKSRFNPYNHLRDRLTDVIAVLFGGLSVKDRERLMRTNADAQLVPLLWSELTQVLDVPGFRDAGHGAGQALTALSSQRDEPHEEASSLLMLYPAAVFAEWRFLHLGPGTVTSAQADYPNILRRMEQVRDHLRGTPALARLGKAFSAMGAAQTMLADALTDRGMEESAATYRQKARSLSAMGQFFSPAKQTALATVHPASPSTTFTASQETLP